MSCPLIKFADDTAMIGLISKHDDRLYQDQLQQFVNFCDLNYLKLNVSKTKKMVIDYRKSHRQPEPVILKDRAVERATCYKYLGVIFDNELGWCKHVDSIVEKLNSRMFCLRKLNSFHMSIVKCWQLFT